MDTNVLLDVTEADSEWLEWFSQQMNQYAGRVDHQSFHFRGALPPIRVHRRG